MRRRARTNFTRHLPFLSPWLRERLCLGLKGSSGLRWKESATAQREPPAALGRLLPGNRQAAYHAWSAHPFEMRAYKSCPNLPSFSSKRPLKSYWGQERGQSFSSQFHRFSDTHSHSLYTSVSKGSTRERTGACDNYSRLVLMPLTLSSHYSTMNAVDQPYWKYI